MDTIMEFESEAKVRVILPEIMFGVINSDAEFFASNKNRMCNQIFAYYSNLAEISKQEISLKPSRTLQFTLNQENIDRFAAVCDTLQIGNKAEYFRQVLYLYCNQPRYLRERILFSKSVQVIEESIKARRKLRIRYKDEYRIVEPYFIIKSDGETRNYLFCYCEKRQEYCNYRLMNFHALATMRQRMLEHYDSVSIEQIRQNFDAFLSSGKQVKVRLSDEGVKFLKRNITHRPKLLEQAGDVYTFECSQLKAQLYFPQFMYHAEILEPASLRMWFKNNFAKVSELYQDITD